MSWSRRRFLRGGSPDRRCPPCFCRSSAVLPPGFCRLANEHVTCGDVGLRAPLRAAPTVAPLDRRALVTGPRGRGRACLFRSSSLRALVPARRRRCRRRRRLWSCGGAAASGDSTTVLPGAATTDNTPVSRIGRLGTRSTYDTSGGRKRANARDRIAGKKVSSKAIAAHGPASARGRGAGERRDGDARRP